MKRPWKTMRSGPDEGSESVALALAQLYDSETLRSLLDAFSAMDRFGGELYVGAYREKFNADNERVTPDEPGDWETIAYAFHYSHVASNTRRMTETPEESEASVSRSSPQPLDNGHSEDETRVHEVVES